MQAGAGGVRFWVLEVLLIVVGAFGSGSLGSQRFSMRDFRGWWDADSGPALRQECIATSDSGEARRLLWY